MLTPSPQHGVWVVTSDEDVMLLFIVPQNPQTPQRGLHHEEEVLMSLIESVVTGRHNACVILEKLEN